MRRILVIVGLLLLPASASAEFTGLQLRDLCSDKSQHAQDFCQTWISGFAAGLFAAQQGRLSGDEVCLPNGFAGKEARLIIEKFMMENPSVLHLTAEPVVLVALAHAFPCKKQ